MKRPFPLILAVVFGLTSIVFVSPPLGAGPFQKSKAQLDDKIRKTTERFVEFQKITQKAIPPAVLAGARGIILIHKFKAGIGIGGEAGGGVALIKDPKTGRWGTPAFVSSAEGSWGFQFGAQGTDIFFVLMTEEGLTMLKGGSVNVGVDLQATAGPSGIGADINTTSLQEPVLVYSNSEGLFAGAAFKGGGIMAAKKNNAGYYGMTLKEILFEKKAQTTLAGRELITAIRANSAQQSGREFSQ